MRLLLLLVLLCGPQIAFSQTIDCLPPAQRIKIADSLRALPEARLSAFQYRTASNYYRNAADSLRAAGALKDTAIAATGRAFNVQEGLTRNEFVQKLEWQGKARRRGVVNWVLAALIGGITYKAIKR